jgi:hypothetical protein
MKEHISKAHEIMNGATAQYRELAEKLSQAEQQIRQDKTLSAHGQRLKVQELKKQHSRQIMEFAKKTKDEFQIEVIRAKGKAERLLDNPHKKPSDATIQKYERGLKDLKTRVMLALRPEKAAELVKEFAEGINDPYIAGQFREHFSDVITPIIQQVRPEAKSDLIKLYDKLDSEFKTEEQREAQQIMEQADAMFSAKIFKPAVTDHIKGSYGSRYADYVNQPDMYFTLEDSEAEAEEPEQE